MKSAEIALVLLAYTLSISAQQQGVKPVQELLRGRVVAQVASLHYGSSLTHSWMSFFFAVEEPGRSVRPIQIGYAFYQSQQLPPDSFWDYSKVYEIRVKREPSCDTTVESLAYVKNTDVNGKELPPSFVLEFAKGAPKDLLKRDAVLPCYTLWYGNYLPVQPESK